MGEKTVQALERIAYLLEGEESEGALMRIADTLEEVAETLDTALGIENEHGLTYQVWRVRRPSNPSRDKATAARGLLHLR